MTSVAVLKELSRETPPEWVASLRAIDPIRDATSYLDFVWFQPEEGEGRWILYEFVPRYATPPEILDELKGFPPDSLPEYETLISQRQWDLYQAHQRWARPCWVLQGSKGGHLVSYEEEHRLAAKAAGLPPDPPDVGDLPYCPWDSRSERQILRLNALLAANNDLDEFRLRNTGDGAKRARKEALREYRRQLVHWLNDSLEEPAEHFTKAFATGEADDLPIRDVDWVERQEKQEAAYIETGSPSATLT